MAFENPSLCCDEPLDFLKYHGTAVREVVVELHGRVHVRAWSSLQLMIYVIQKAVFDEFGFSRYLAGCGPEFINFFAPSSGRLNIRGWACPVTFQIRETFTPTSSDIVECEHDEAGKIVRAPQARRGARGFSSGRVAASPVRLRMARPTSRSIGRLASVAPASYIGPAAASIGHLRVSAGRRGSSRSGDSAGLAGGPTDGLVGHSSPPR